MTMSYEVEPPSIREDAETEEASEESETLARLLSTVAPPTTVAAGALPRAAQDNLLAASNLARIAGWQRRSADLVRGNQHWRNVQQFDRSVEQLAAVFVRETTHVPRRIDHAAVSPNAVQKLGEICEELSRDLSYGEAKLRVALAARGEWLPVGTTPDWFLSSLEDAISGCELGERPHALTIQSAKNLLAALADGAEFFADHCEVRVGLGGTIEVDLIPDGGLTWEIGIPKVGWPGCRVVAMWLDQDAVPPRVVTRFFHHARAALEHARKRTESLSK